MSSNIPTGLVRSMPNFSSFFSLLGVCLAHAGLLLVIWVQAPAGKPIEISQPTVKGVIIAMAPTPAQPIPPSPAEVSLPPPPPEKPKPQPKPQPKLKPKPVEKHKPQPANPQVPSPQNAITPTAPPTPQATPTPTQAPQPQELPVQAPRIDASHLKNPAPQYPSLSRRLREQGKVLLELLILANGSVGEVRVKTSSGYERLDKAALDAVKAWRYLPAKRGGLAIPYRYLQPIEFSLAN